MVSRRARTRRNAALTAATAVTAALLFLYPTSTVGGLRKTTAQLAPVGVVTANPTPPAQGGTPTSGHEMGGHVGFEAPEPQLINGPAIDTFYGPVQVQIRIIGGIILDVKAIAYPQESAVDKVINSQAIPLLEQATLAVQGAGVDTISGATSTSDGYRRSLQAALDAADL